jgi:hypothetical protein
MNHVVPVAMRLAMAMPARAVVVIALGAWRRG